MKLAAVAAILTTLSLSSASPSLRRQDSAASVQQSIQHWIDDVNSVNNFLDSAVSLFPNPTALAAAATTALASAMDEPNELKILGAVPGLDSAGTSAVTKLGDNFSNVISALQAIIADPSDTDDTVIGSLEIINGDRCCIVLPQLDILWPAAASAAGAPPPPPANVPASCVNGPIIGTC